MEKLIDITSKQVAPYLNLLLKDKTTKRNIIWATDTYDAYGKGFRTALHQKNNLTGNIDFTAYMWYHVKDFVRKEGRCYNGKKRKT